LSKANINGEFNKESQNYNIVIQNEFLKANHMNLGDTISFTPNTKLKISASVKFNEVTYPTIGTNFVSNMKESSFVGINLTDYMNLLSNNDLMAIDVSFGGFYFGTNEGYDRLNKLST